MEYLASEGRSTKDSAVDNWLSKHGIKAERVYDAREVKLAMALAQQRMNSGYG